MEHLAGTLMRLFALTLKLPEGYFDDKTEKHSSKMIVGFPRSIASPIRRVIRLRPGGGNPCRFSTCRTTTRSLTLLKTAPIRITRQSIRLLVREGI